MSKTYSKDHIGRKISCLRELRGITQAEMATALGVSQQTVSNIEKSMQVGSGLLVQIADVLELTPRTIEKFDKDQILHIISKFYEASDIPHMDIINTPPSFILIDKLIEVYEENKKLYERLIETTQSLSQYLS